MTMKKKVLMLVLSAFCPLWALAQFSGQGSGTEEDPYQITNAEELYLIRSNLSSAFVLMNDIDLTDWLAENNPETGWPQLGTLDMPYSGVFDGKGHTIKYSINNIERGNAGLFAYVSGTIKNLNVIGTLNCYSGGGIVGYSKSGSTISDCTFRGSIISKAGAGGIANKISGTTIARCSVAGSINGCTVGGIIGATESLYNYVNYCSFFGDLISVGVFEYCGGIAGACNSEKQLRISNCFYQGKIISMSDNNSVGGIIGYGRNSVINNCIVVSPALKSTYNTGGIVAICSSTTITSCVAIVDTLQYSSGQNCYRIAQSAKNDGTSSESLALATMIVRQNKSDKNDVVKEGTSNGINMGRSMLMKALTYTSHDFDMKKVWDIDEGNGYPYLRCAADFMSIMDDSPNIPFEETDVAKLTDAIYANPVTAFLSSEATMTINLKNAQATNAYSFDLVLPEGVTIDSYTLSSRHNGHAETMNRNETTGVYSFAVLSLQSKEVEGNDGAIWTLKLKMADNMAEGDYAVKIQNAKYSLTSGSAKVTMPETISKLTIENYVKGDVNGDGEADIADAVCIVNHVVGKATPVFVAKAADVNGDGDADIADAVRIVNLVVGKIDVLARKYEGDLNSLDPE